ncbi:MAG: SUMF1/EgtB/PvdO family nonheme iron enzyme [Planctomycetes bacterium]|nr:SUMF1/EgtB/PvdO family nonheme iron enzyme [Planctomycetota bacterium]
MSNDDDRKTPFDRARALFEAVWSLPPERREAHLRAEAGGDRQLLDEVRRLLAHAATGKTNDLRGAADPGAAGDGDGDGGAEQIGPFRVLGKLGEGGMGLVYLAEQRQPIRRRVALKVLKRGMDSKAFLARFEAERQALALMEHSCIARVYDAGVAASGQPYLAMEYVKGVPITDYCDQNKLSIAQRIDLFLAVCSAVQHAHTKGVMHRDLKPSNVLVTTQDGQPEPKIIDFGLAKAVDHRLVEATVFTETGQIIGTPEYMSPEQAGVGGLDIDTRTDVFSLGVLLYQLLTGTLPVTREELLRHGYYEMQRVIREGELPKPSTKITTLGDGAKAFAKARRMPLAELQKQLRGDLDWIVMKAIEKDRNRRYTTAHELGADLLRHLHDEPVTAGPPSAGYVLKKLAKRYRGPVVAGVGMFVALGIGLAVAVWQWGEAARQRDVAEENERKAQAAEQVAASERDRFKELFTRYRRLEDKARLSQFDMRAAELWPEGPAAVDRMAAWVQEVDAWIAGMPDHLAALAELRAAGAQRDGSWRFEDDAVQFLHDALAEFVVDLDAFRGARGNLARVRGGLEWSRRVWQDTIVAHDEQWRAMNARLLVNPRYSGLELLPQPGLVPLGRDPRTKLEEFAFVRSGSLPARRADGVLQCVEDTAIVLVLLPGGAMSIGSEPGGAVFENETPRREVELAAFFVGKYEVTQSQWRALAGENPSTYQSANSGWNPVESVVWYEATAVLARCGLLLPTEAQWEYACRAGTTTLWIHGDRREDLVGPDGLGLLNAASGPIGDAKQWPEFDDGFDVHIGPGHYPANAFGLYDVHGNVAELTRGQVVVRHGRLKPLGAVEFGPDDGVILGAETEWTVARGGSFFRCVEDARSARRVQVKKDDRSESVGLRVTRRIDR